MLQKILFGALRASALMLLSASAIAIAGCAAVGAPQSGFAQRPAVELRVSTQPPRDISGDMLKCLHDPKACFGNPLDFESPCLKNLPNRTPKCRWVEVVQG